MYIKLKRPKAIDKLRSAGRLVSQTFDMLREHVRPGVSLIELDTLAEAFIIKHGAKPLYKGYKGSAANHPPFPGTICASVNEQICHGIPTKRVLQEGDIIGVDIGLRLAGWCGDACVTYPVGQISAEAQRLLDVAERSLYVGIEAAAPDGFLNAIGNAIHDYADSQDVTVVREWGGHGVGRDLHEAPSVSHIRSSATGPRLKPGMVFTIEPMINMGKHHWDMTDDGWTVVTRDGSLSAQFEHTVAITEDGVVILSAP